MITVTIAIPVYKSPDLWRHHCCCTSNLTVAPRILYAALLFYKTIR